MLSRSFPKKPLSAAIAFAIAVTVLPAFAQSPAPAPAPATDTRTPEQRAADEAATKAKTDAQQLERVIVTATGRPQPASRVPINVTAIQEEQLREENITDVKKLIENSASVNAPGNGARFADSVTVRGLNVSPVNANNIEQFTRSTIAYYLDDTPLPNIAYRIKDIARVETLLGPQGTLYGAGSLGGTIRYITNQPEFGITSLRGSTSIYQIDGGKLSHDTDVVANVPLGENLVMRGVVSRLEDNGYIDRISNPPWRTGTAAWTTKPDATKNVYPDHDKNRVTSGRIAFAMRLNRDWRATFSHADQSQLAQGTSAVSLLPCGIANAQSQADIDTYIRRPRTASLLCNSPTSRYASDWDTPVTVNDSTVVSRYPEFANRKFRLTSLDLEGTLPFARLRSSTSAFRDSRVGQADYASQGWVFYWSLGDSGAAFDSDRSAYMSFDNTYKGISHETRLTSTGTGPLSWIAGLYYTKNERALRFSEWLPGLDSYIGLNRVRAGGVTDEGYRENLASKYQEIALYGEASYAITPKWNATVGARVFNYKDTATVNIRDYTFDLVNNNVTSTTKDDGKSYYKFNTSYNFTPDVFAYATVSQGFRRGGSTGFRGAGGKELSEEAKVYQPDSTTNYELGVKSFWLDRRVYLQANVFQIDWKDVQTYRDQDIDGFPVNGTANAGNARSKGFELYARVRPTDNLSLSYSTAYTEAEWTSTKTHCLYADRTACRTWTAGGQMGGAPAWKHTFSGRYSLPFARDYDAFVGFSGRYVGKLQIDREDSPTTEVREFPAFTLFNVRGGFTFRGVDASLWISNVANKRAIVSSQGGTNDIMGRRVFFTQPRTFGMNLSYAFR